MLQGARTNVQFELFQSPSLANQKTYSDWLFPESRRTCLFSGYGKTVIEVLKYLCEGCMDKKKQLCFEEEEQVLQEILIFEKDRKDLPENSLKEFLRNLYHLVKDTNNFLQESI